MNIFENDEDSINSPKHKNSLTEFLIENPEGVGEDKISRLLNLPKEKVEEILASALAKMKRKMIIGENDEV